MLQSILFPNSYSYLASPMNDHPWIPPHLQLVHKELSSLRNVFDSKATLIKQGLGG